MFFAIFSSTQICVLGSSFAYGLWIRGAFFQLLELLGMLFMPVRWMLFQIGRIWVLCLCVLKILEMFHYLECNLFMSALLVQKLNCCILFFHCLSVPDKYLLFLVFSFVPNSFKNFDLEESQKCTVDWLMIGPSSKREEYKVCGSSIPPSFISARDHVWIFFHSDASSSGQSQGFRLSYIRGKTLQFCWLCLHSLVINLKTGVLFVDERLGASLGC